MTAAIVAFGAISALGEGERAASAGAIGEPARVAIAPDAELEAAGLGRTLAARASLGETREDRATALLVRAMRACARELDEAVPGWRARRIGLAVGTSSGGMRSAERLFRGEEVAARDATYFGPLHAALADLGLCASPATLILGACASSSIAVGLGARWIDEARCDLVLCGGFDALSRFVAAGFEALHATTASGVRPFRRGRDGMALGEGAAILALAPPSAPRALAYVAGSAASCDAFHLTAPDREGRGLARAIEGALKDAAIGAHEIDLLSLHATATPFNDAAEARALATALGARAREIPVHPFKAQVGHTLGAAGALESLACIDAMRRGLFPAAAGAGEADPDAPARLLDVGMRGSPRVALKLASAFGGANAALVLTRDPPRRPPRAPRAAFVTRAVQITRLDDSRRGLADERAHPSTLVRADALVRFALAALAALEAEVGPLAGAGIVAGHALATLETNALFDAKIRERGARAAEPRRFPYTSPNAVSGECAARFGLTGPAFAVGGGPHGALEALAVARDLVALGDADRVVVVAADDVGPATAKLGALAEGLTSGATALLVTADAARAAARIGDAEVVLGPGAREPGAEPCAEKAVPCGPCGHNALAPLARALARTDLPICLVASSLNAFAKITLLSV